MPRVVPRALIQVLALHEIISVQYPGLYETTKARPMLQTAITIEIGCLSYLY